MTEAGRSNESWDDRKTRKRALSVSLALHAGLVLLAVFGLPFLHSKPEPVTIIPVDMVSEDDLTSQEIAETPVENAEERPPAETLEDTPEPESVQESLPDSQTTQAPEPPSLNESRPQESETAAEAIPEPETAESVPDSEVAESAPELETQDESEAETETQSETVPETAEAETAEEALETAEAIEEETEDRLSEVTPPTPRPRPEETPDVVEDSEPEEEQVAQEQTSEPEPEPEPEPAPEPEQETAEEETAEPQEDRLSSILRNVEEMESQRRQQENSGSGEETPEEPRSLDDRRKAQQLAQAIQAQVARCWRVDAGAQRAEDLVVPIRVQLAPDGRLRQPPEIQNSARMNRDRYYRAAAENARRAVLECQPFDLPSEDYALWRDIILNFNPREMF